MSADTIVDDLELYLTARYRQLLAERPEPFCSDFVVDRRDWDPENGPRPDRMLIIRDDGGPTDGLGVGTRSVGLRILAGTLDDPRDAADAARMVLALRGRLPGLEAGNPITSVLRANGPFAVAEPGPQAARYLTLTLGVAGRTLA